jgi:hypothetical protein
MARDRDVAAFGELAARAPQAGALAGIDAAPAMIRVARDAATDGRLRFVAGTAASKSRLDAVPYCETG